MNARELERKAETAELLLNAARQLGESLEPENVYERFRELLAGVVQHDGVVVSAYDEGDELIRCEYACVGDNRLDPATLPPVPLNREGGGMQSRVILTGEAFLFNDVIERVQEPDGTYYDVDSEGSVKKIPDAGPALTRAAMMVPVKHEGRVVGVVQVMSDQQQYEQEHLELVEGLVAQMAAAVRNARLREERTRLESAELAARAIAAERERAAQVLEAVGDGVFLVDDVGVVRLWNRAASLVTGLGSDAVVGRTAGEAFSDWEFVAAEIPIADHGAVARPVTLPVSVGSRELWLSFVAVRDVHGVVYAFRDLSGERRLEEEKSDFIATISHELRTPMAAVYGAAQTLLRPDIDASSEAGTKLLEMIAAQSARLSQITEEVLLASRLDRGELAVERGAVDVGELVQATVETLRQQHDRELALDVEIVPGLPQASGDADRIQQILVNLLDNAVKYAGAAPIAVRVEGTNGVVRISVADGGPGVDVSEQQRIFEKFYRVDPHLHSAPGGTGLGLYISRELAERMGGSVDVSSEPGAGATFVVELPRA